MIVIIILQTLIKIKHALLSFYLKGSVTSMLLSVSLRLNILSKKIVSKNSLQITYHHYF